MLWELSSEYAKALEGFTPELGHTSDSVTL